MDKFTKRAQVYMNLAYTYKRILSKWMTCIKIPFPVQELEGIIFDALSHLSLASITLLRYKEQNTE